MGHQIYHGVSSEISTTYCLNKTRWVCILILTGYVSVFVKWLVIVTWLINRLKGINLHGQRVELLIEERLARALTDTDWLQLFPNAKHLNLIATHSDQSPIMLDCEPKPRVKRKFMFRFENKWLGEDGIMEIIQGWKAREEVEVENCIVSFAYNLVDWCRNRGRDERLEFARCK
ncbi:unnamed protein product [Vicia faba]|nr:unnamed protein product [Vicia faba]